MTMENLSRLQSIMSHLNSSVIAKIASGFNLQYKDKVQTIWDIDQQMISYVSFLWSIGTTFNDLQALNLMYLQGLIPISPYYLGSLDSESSIIISQLYELNKLDIITCSSQPYEHDTSYTGEIYRQRPYLNFYYHSSKINQLISRLLQRKPSLFVHVIDIKKIGRVHV